MTSNNIKLKIKGLKNKQGKDVYKDIIDVLKELEKFEHSINVERLIEKKKEECKWMLKK